MDTYNIIIAAKTTTITKNEYVGIKKPFIGIIKV